MQEGATNFYYARDHLGSIREKTDSTGAIVGRYDYEPWGEQTTLAGTPDTFGYAGYFVHQPSGLLLTWYRAYDPNLARWISRDPIEEAGGINLYAYVRNNPISQNDPLGLMDAGDCVVAGALVGGVVGGIIGGVAGLAGIVGGPVVVVTSGAGASYGAGIGVLAGGALGGLICGQSKSDPIPYADARPQEKCPPKNNNEHCEKQWEADRATCQKWWPASNKQMPRACYAHAMVRRVLCEQGSPVPPLQPMP